MAERERIDIDISWDIPSIWFNEYGYDHCGNYNVFITPHGTEIFSINIYPIGINRMLNKGTIPKDAEIELVTKIIEHEVTECIVTSIYPGCCMHGIPYFMINGFMLQDMDAFQFVGSCRKRDVRVVERTYY